MGIRRVFREFITLPVVWAHLDFIFKDLFARILSNSYILVHSEDLFVRPNIKMLITKQLTLLTITV